MWFCHLVKHLCIFRHHVVEDYVLINRQTWSPVAACGGNLHWLAPQAIKVICFVAACAADDGSSAAEEASRHLDPSCKLPACGDEGPQLVVGTLDLNIGN